MSGLQVAGIRQRYGALEVLDGIDLTLPTGKVLALLGASGSGKTTLLRVIAGFEPAIAGTIALEGRVLEAPGVHVPAERRRIGYVPQEGTLFPHLTVAGNVGFGLTRAERRSGRVTEVLRLAKLDGLERRYPHEISGGQQQRVALARALAPRPGLILLDEPFNALDLALRRSVSADVIALLRASAATTVLVTHDPQEAFASADLVAVMQAGRILQCGSPTEVYRRPASLQSARLTGSTIEIEAVVRDGQAQTALGVLALSPGCVPDGPARVMLRPEQVVPTTCADGVPAQRVDSVFRGDHMLVTVAVAGTKVDVRLNGVAELNGPLHLKVTGECVAFQANPATPAGDLSHRPLCQSAHDVALGYQQK